MGISLKQREELRMWRFLAKNLLMQACEELDYDYKVQWEGRGNYANTAYCIPEIVALSVHETECRLRAYPACHLQADKRFQTLDLRYPSVANDIRKFIKRACESYHRCRIQDQEFEKNFWPTLSREAKSRGWKTHVEGFLGYHNEFVQVDIAIGPSYRPFRRIHSKLCLDIERSPNSIIQIESATPDPSILKHHLSYQQEEWYSTTISVPICYETVFDVLKKQQDVVDQFDALVKHFIKGVNNYFHGDFDLA